MTSCVVALGVVAGLEVVPAGGRSSPAVLKLGEISKYFWSPILVI